LADRNTFEAQIMDASSNLIVSRSAIPYLPSVIAIIPPITATLSSEVLLLNFSLSGSSQSTAWTPASEMSSTGMAKQPVWVY